MNGKALKRYRKKRVRIFPLQYTMVGGNPARVIRKRFDEELIGLLLELKWWDFPPEKLTAFLPVLCNKDLDAVRQAVKTALAEKETL